MLVDSERLQHAGNAIHVVFIDALHEYESVVSDVLNTKLFRHAKTLIFDDYGLPHWDHGVRGTSTEGSLFRCIYTILLKYPVLTYLMRCRSQTFHSRNAYAIFYQRMQCHK